MIETKTFYGREEPIEVEVSLKFAYPDWCKVEKSDCWKELLLLEEKICKRIQM